MKLDSIIYDTTTLANAISEKLLEESPTFKAMYPSETSTALVNVLAGYGSMLQYTIVSALANCYTDTAYSPSAIYQLAETLGNRLHGNVSSQLYCDITRTSLQGKNNVVIPAYSTFEVEGLPFFNTSPIAFAKNVNTVHNVLLTQGEYTSVEFYTSGAAGEKLYFSNDFKCNMNMVRVYVEDKEWDTIDSFLPLNSMTLIDLSQASTVVLRMNSDGRAYIKFGNNANGALPQAGSKVRIEYVSNEGSAGNIEKTNMNVQLMSQIYYVNQAVNTLLTVDIATNQPAYGGYDKQSLDILRESSPYVFASGDRAVRREDYKAILLNKCGYISANVWGEYEEAKSYGGYDKIMMNMVYYTGIKEIQQYDYRPMGGLGIKDSEEGVTAENPVLFTNVLGNIKGFPGSYEIDLSYSIDDTINIRYADKKGNGVLVCDPSDNGTWDNIDQEYLYPYNDSYDLFKKTPTGEGFIVRCLQAVDDSPNHIRDRSLLFDINNPDEFHSHGLYDEGAQMKIGFDTPLQILIQFPEFQAKAISMFSFKTPDGEDNVGRFPGSISIYATNNITDGNITNPSSDPFFNNIKNNSEWTRIAEVQKLNVPEEDGKWSDWVTTNLYNPNDETLYATGGWKTYKRYMIEIYNLHDLDLVTWGNGISEQGKCYIGKMKFLFNEVRSDRYAWGEQQVTVEDPETHEITQAVSPKYYTKTDTPVPFDELDPDQDPDEYLVYDENLNKKIGWYVNGSYNDEHGNYITVRTPDERTVGSWKTSGEPGDNGADNCTLRNTNFDYTRIVLPDESIQDNRVLDHKTSTINYEENSTVDLCVPAVKEGMSYYKYNAIVTGLTAANGYRAGDILSYSFNNGFYANVRVANINTESYEITINNIRGSLAGSNEVQRGNRKLEVADVALDYVYGYNTGNGAKITVTSTDAIDVYGTFTGNAYSTATAQAIDSPVIEQYNHFTTYTEFKQPRVKNVKVDVTVEYLDSYSYKDTRRKVEEAIYKVFDITPYYVGKSLDVSDIWAAINEIAGVKRFIVTYPTENIDCEPYEFITLQKNNLTITDKFSEDFK